MRGRPRILTRQFPTYEYFVTGEKVGNCAKMNQPHDASR